ncbi:lysine--tRNA ligase [Hydrogenimonas sp.]
MIFDNQYQQQRIQKAQTLKEMGINPYQNRAVKECSNKEFLEKYAYLKESEEKEEQNQSCTVTGRIKFLRLMGKAAFAKIEDDSGVLQIYFSRDDLGDEWFKTVKKMIEVGDIVAATGYPFVTRTGELTMHVKRLELVTKAITPLPEKFHGLQDKELRYRQRYLDLIMNPEVKRTFLIRSKIVSLIRRFFEDHGFLEVETPMMHPIPGGANARPFVTHHHALDVERYLRIAPELYLKRLLVGGFEAVFEINRNFRNEGMDATHNPEFTMIEFYWAYHRYEDLMELTEKLFEYLFKELNLPTKLPYGDKEIDFSTPFKKIAYKDALVQIGGVPEEILEDTEAMHRYLKEHDIEVESHLSKGQLWGEMFDAFVEEKLIDPTFVTHFPIDISPLARRSDDNPEIADRFELFIAGKEIANGFSELNDPLDQYARFKAQAAQKESDDEAMYMDEDYVRALGYGMPPAAGEGIGIDRLVMLLTNQHTIRDVILFPAMRPQKTQNEEESKKSPKSENEKEENR